MINEQIVCKKLDLALTATEIFAHFAEKAHAVLLDSANPSHVNNRYDIIAIDPVSVIEVINKQCFVNGQPVAHSAFTAMKHALVGLSTEKAPFGLPFNGGLLGYFSYDLGRSIENLPALAEQDISLAEMSVGLYLDALIYDHALQQWYYVAQPQVDAHARINELLNTINAPQPHFSDFTLKSPWRSNLTKDEYANRFNRVHQYLLSGDCYQINLAQRFHARFNGSPWQAYLTLRETNKAPFSAYINLPNHQILSLSPERFIEVKDRLVETKPIKGTISRSHNLEQDETNKAILASSAKDQAENVMIVDLLRNDLGKVAQPGSVHVPKLFDIESFSAVHHLVSTVRSRLNHKSDAIDQLEAAFPGGSITGAPKIRAMEIIDELEPHRRSIYCGSIGYISAAGDMDTSITIRTLICENQQVYCWAGGGIVADSTLAAEYQETYDKVNRILPVLGQSIET